MRVILFANSDWYLYNYRLTLAKFLQRKGHEVILISPHGKYAAAIEAEGFVWHRLDFSRRSMHPGEALKTVFQLRRLLRELRPDVLHNFTLKSVLYGSLAAKGLGVGRVINAVTGRGYLFINHSMRVNIAKWITEVLLRFALKGSRVIFQNEDDMRLYIDLKLVEADQASLIYGSGVDVERFVPARQRPAEMNIILPSRLLADKGVYEFVEAARIVHIAHPSTKFILVGEPDEGNPSSIHADELQVWVQDGLVAWWGWQDDMLQVYHRASIVCLPSYSEGLAKCLLEAAACGIPIITTDIAGCREAVLDGESGFLVPVRDAKALARSIMNVVDQRDLLVLMGKKGRGYIIRNFSVNRVINDTYQYYIKG